MVRAGMPPVLWLLLSLLLAGPFATSASAQAPAQAPPPARQPPGYPEAARRAQGERIELPLARLFVPDGWAVPASGRVPLCVHFQGGPTSAEENFVRMERPGVLIASTIQGLSSAFARPYRDPRAFAALLAAGEQALGARAGRAVQFTDLVVTFWSAGYGAVRELLRDPDHFARIEALVSADSIYADVVAAGVRAPRVEQMVDFARFAQAAARGEKTFVLAHGRYRTDYASTAETAAFLCASVAARPVPPAAPAFTGRGVPIALTAHAGGFHCYEFAEATPGIHVDCLCFVPEMVRRHVPPPGAGPAVRLVCWNIHHGRGRDGRVDLPRIAAELAALRPDLVCLQEVDRGVARSGGLDEPAELARALGMHPVFGHNIDHQGGAYGNAILSRWPVAWHANHHYRMLRPDEQRGLLMATAATGRGELPFGTTHLEANRDDSERLAQVPEILAACAGRALAFAAGDFNDLPDGPLHRRLLEHLDDAWLLGGQGDGHTFPAQEPTRRIDWVLVRRDGPLRVTSARTVPTAASDHCPLVVDFAWR